MEYDMSQILQLAQSPAGKQLMEILQKKNTVQLQKAAKMASEGDFAMAKKQIASLLDSPQIQNLLKQMEDQK